MFWGEGIDVGFASDVGDGVDAQDVERDVVHAIASILGPAEGTAQDGGRQDGERGIEQNVQRPARSLSSLLLRPSYCPSSS